MAPVRKYGGSEKETGRYENHFDVVYNQESRIHAKSH